MSRILKDLGSSGTGKLAAPCKSYQKKVENYPEDLKTCHPGRLDGSRRRTESYRAKADAILSAFKSIRRLTVSSPPG